MAASEESPKKLPICLLVLGKAGVGKTTFVNKLVEVLHANSNPPYVINMDPACHSVPYPVNVDIRTTVKYKEVMEQYNMGPNGAITTSLNLFTTVFDQLMNLLGERAADREFIIVDTPGQMEVFNWSASGSIITKSLASTYPTILVFLMDLKNCQKPNTLLTNLLSCCSVMFLHKLPILAVLNKMDSASPAKIINWMGDFTEFREALLATSSLRSTINSSFCLVLEDFYRQLHHVALSSVTGQGMEQLFPAIHRAVEEYHRDFRPIFQRLMTQPKKVKDDKLKLLPEGARNPEIAINLKHSLLDEEDSEEDDDYMEDHYFQEALNQS